MMSRATTRIFVRNILKKDGQWISKLNLWQNGIHLKSISKSLKQILYVLTWAQIWQQRRKKWVKLLLKIQGDRLGIWKGGALLGGVFFRFDKDGIQNEELVNVFEDTQLPCSPTELTSKNSKEEIPKNNTNWWKGPLVSNDTKNKLCENGWECLISKSDFVIFRKLKENSTAYIYKVFGRNFDISAADFFFTQVDNSYRKSWDKYVSDIICLDENEETNQQLLYWVAKYPYPMMARDYLLVRKTIIDRGNNRMGIISRTTTNTEWPPVSNNVRVDEYSSDMLIFAHTRIDQTGFDFQFTSVDNPKTNFPQRFTNYAVTSGLPDYINRLYEATKDLGRIGNEEFPDC